MNQLKLPLVSICIPVYNCERYIAKAIESVLSQTYWDYQLIILNNCSTDGTANIIQQYNDHRIRVINNETNIGAAGNWNLALSEAKSKYIKILCADDILYPTCLERQVYIMEHQANKDVVLVSCGRDIINEQGTRIMSRVYSGGRIQGNVAVKRTVRAGTNIFGEPVAVLLRSEAISGIGTFDWSMQYVIDLHFWCRILTRGDAYIIPEALCAFRISAASWSVSVTRSQVTDFRRLYEKLIEVPYYKISVFDLILGNIKIILNKMMRQIFYMVFLQSKKGAHKP